MWYLFQNNKGQVLQKCILLLLLFISAINISARPKVTATIDQDTVVMGDRFVLHLSSLSHISDEIEWPFIAGKLQDIDVVGNSKLDTTYLSGDSLKIEADIYLSVFEPGVVAVPGVEFKYKYKGRENTVRTKPAMLTVAGIAIDTTRGLMPIKGPIDIPVKWTEWLPRYLFFAFSFLLLGLLLFYFFKRAKNKKEPQIEMEVIHPPHEIALGELQDLKAKKLVEAGEHKAYYVELTDIIRAYIEKRFSFPAMESTADEIIEGLKKTDANPKLIDKMVAIFDEADLAKFAKAKPDDTLCKKGMKDSMDFVQHTKLKEQEAETIERIVEAENPLKDDLKSEE